MYREVLVCGRLNNNRSISKINTSLLKFFPAGCYATINSLKLTFGTADSVGEEDRRGYCLPLIISANQYKTFAESRFDARFYFDQSGVEHLVDLSEENRQSHTIVLLKSD